MKDLDLNTMTSDEFGEARDPRPEVQDFDRVVDAALWSRGFLRGVLDFGSAAAAMGLAA